MEPIFSAVVESIEKAERDQKTVHYTSTNQLLTSYMEKGEFRVKFARTEAALHVW